MRVENLTEHPHAAAVAFDLSGNECLIVVVKLTYRLSTGLRDPGLAPLPVAWADALSPSGAVCYPADVVVTRTGTNVVCRGRVRSPSSGARSVDVALAVGGMRRDLRAFGVRRWMRAPTGWVASAPEPFTEIGLGFEEAFGGRSADGYEPRNPIGKGWLPPGADPDGVELPRLEDASALIQSPEDRPDPACFAAVASHWELTPAPPIAHKRV